VSNLLFLLSSRKFWISILGLASVLLVSFGRPELPVDTLVDAIVAIVTVLVGSIAVEDGLSRR
jgi:uncharacterized membrane protein